MHGAWAQWQHDDTSGKVTGSDAMTLRLWWIDDFIPADAWTLPGTSGGSTPWQQALK